MFTNILFLILALLLINATPADINLALFPPTVSFLYSLLLYAGVCILIWFQTILLKKIFRVKHAFLFLLASLELLSYLYSYQYILNAGRFFNQIPFLNNFQVINATWELILYMGGLIIYYAAYFTRYYSQDFSENRWQFGVRQVRFFIPFAIPFLLLTLSYDLLNLFFTPAEQASEFFEILSIGVSLGLILIFLLFIPYFIQKIWLCEPLEEGVLNQRLQALCQKANFKHGGMMRWSIMHDQLTAGIIGLHPRFRYVMFTDRLIKEMPIENIEAILAHEIGHQAKRHLIWYPFILSGMVLASLLLIQLTYPYLVMGLNQIDLLFNAHLSVWIAPFIFFSLYALIVILYFRYIFGFFSRNFERQADLHVFSLGIDPHHMIDALKMVATTSGGYDTPNWHHYSIKERVEFLEAAIDNPQIIINHHRKVKLILGSYVILFIALVFLLLVV